MNAFKLFEPFKSFKPYFGGFNDHSWGSRTIQTSGLNGLNHFGGSYV